jgi:hypothetical protein
MARRKAADEAKVEDVAASKWARTAGGDVKGQFTIKPEHDLALREEAARRMQAAGRRKMNTSEVLREVLDEWLRRRK